MSILLQLLRSAQDANLPFVRSLVQFVDHPADFCFRLPDHLSHEEGAMVEPLSVGVHAVRRAGVSPGKTVAIMGAGPIGKLSAGLSMCTLNHR